MFDLSYFLLYMWCFNTFLQGEKQADGEKKNRTLDMFKWTCSNEKTGISELREMSNLIIPSEGHFGYLKYMKKWKPKRYKRSSSHFPGKKKKDFPPWYVNLNMILWLEIVRYSFEKENLKKRNYKKLILLFLKHEIPSSLFVFIHILLKKRIKLVTRLHQVLDNRIRANIWASL